MTLQAKRLTKIVKEKEIIGSKLRTNCFKNSTTSDLIYYKNNKKIVGKDVRFRDGSFTFII